MSIKRQTGESISLRQWFKQRLGMVKPSEDSSVTLEAAEIQAVRQQFIDINLLFYTTFHAVIHFSQFETLANRFADAIHREQLLSSVIDSKNFTLLSVLLSTPNLLLQMYKGGGLLNEFLTKVAIGFRPLLKEEIQALALELEAIAEEEKEKAKEKANEKKIAKHKKLARMWQPPPTVHVSAPKKPEKSQVKPAKPAKAAKASGSSGKPAKVAKVTKQAKVSAKASSAGKSAGKGSAGSKSGADSKKLKVFGKFTQSAHDKSMKMAAKGIPLSASMVANLLGESYVKQEENDSTFVSSPF